MAAVLRAAGALPPAAAAAAAAALIAGGEGGEGGEWLRGVAEAANAELQTHADGTKRQYLATNLLTLTLTLTPTQP